MKKILIELSDPEYNDIMQIKNFERGSAYPPNIAIHAIQTGKELGYPWNTEESSEKSPVYQAGYVKALVDYYYAIEKIVFMPDKGGYTGEQLKEIFGTSITQDILKNNSPREIMDKIKEYENKQKIKIKVGEKISVNNSEGEILSVNKKEDGTYVIDVRLDITDVTVKGEKVKANNFIIEK